MKPNATSWPRSRYVANETARLPVKDVSQLIESLLCEIDQWKLRDPARLPHLVAALTAVNDLRQQIMGHGASLAESKGRVGKYGSVKPNAMDRHFALESAAFKAWCDGRDAIESYGVGPGDGSVSGIGSFVPSGTPVPPDTPDSCCPRCEGRIAWLLRIVAEASRTAGCESASLMSEAERLALVDLEQADGCWG